MRIVSLLPAGTEIVAALGRMEHLVGVSHECDYPPAARSLPRVTTSAIDARLVAAAPSRLAAGVIDASVREFSATGSPLFDLDEQAMAALAPDVIVTQSLCDVCAVSESDVRALAARLDPRPRVVTLGATTLDGVFSDIQAVAEALGAVTEAAALERNLRDRIVRVHETLKAARASRPRVAVIEWTDPVYAAGHWTPELVHRAGGIDVLSKPGSHSRSVSVEIVRAAEPDVIIIAPCGYDLARAAEEGRVLLRGEWDWARGLRVWAMDGNAFLSRPGPRLVDGLEILAGIFAEGLFPAPAEPHAVRL